MAYQIDRYNNTQLTIVEDGTIDQTTDLKFIGKNYAGYGEIQNENFLFLLENFAGNNPPPKALSGQLWFDAAASKLKFNDGSRWRTTGGAEVSASEPAGLAEGDFWWDTANEQLYAYNGTGFVLIGPQAAGEGSTQMQSRTVRDTLGTTRSIIAAVINDIVIYIISPAEFTLDSSINPITGFDRIKKGLTLVNTTLATDGVTSSDHYYWGTASNALRLGGFLADDYVRKSNAEFSGIVRFPDIGITIGDSDDLHIYIENGNEGVIANEVGVSNKIKMRNIDSSGNFVTPVQFTATGIETTIDNTYDIGTVNQKFKNIHSTTFTGEATKATSMRVGTEFRTASISVSANTVAVRDATGNISANIFQGTATAARFADLAEKYTTEYEHPVGTVMEICDHTDHEAGPASASSVVIGVISAEPAYLMNSECNGQAIGLKGRVPVRVIGAVKKGQAVYAWKDGVASTVQTSGLVGVALESNDAEGEKLIECVLKV